MTEPGDRRWAAVATAAMAMAAVAVSAAIATAVNGAGAARISPNPKKTARPAPAAHRPPAAAAVPSGAGDDHVAFAIQYADIISDFRVLGLFVLPHETVEITIARPVDGATPFELFEGKTEVPMRPAGGWAWLAPPGPGLHVLRVEPVDGSPGMTLNVFVIVPFGELRNGKINGYRIGAYPNHPKDNRAVYRLPRGFIEVTAAVEDTRISPHFRLKQFLCKQASGYPKYLILLERLVLKLEWILERARTAGFATDTFFVMSGYRTPAYNASLGNVEFSIHQWGGAADIFIDESPDDGRMDDLNGDRAVDIKDAIVLQALVERMEKEDLASPYIGGLGLYGPTSAHGPFIHVDVRGFRARW